MPLLGFSALHWPDLAWVRATIPISLSDSLTGMTSAAEQREWEALMGHTIGPLRGLWKGKAWLYILLAANLHNMLTGYAVGVGHSGHLRSSNCPVKSRHPYPLPTNLPREELSHCGIRHALNYHRLHDSSLLGPNLPLPSPRQKWNPTLPGHCILLLPYIWNGILNVMTDFMVLLMPVPRLVAWKVPLRRKLVIGVILATGSS